MHHSRLLTLLKQEEAPHWFDEAVAAKKGAQALWDLIRQGWNPEDSQNMTGPKNQCPSCLVELQFHPHHAYCTWLKDFVAEPTDISDCHKSNPQGTL
jgi:hypothetical protein